MLRGKQLSSCCSGGGAPLVKMHYIEISFEVIADRKRHANVIWQLSAKLLGTLWSAWGRGVGLKSGLFTTALTTSLSAFQLKLRPPLWARKKKREKKKPQQLTASLCHFLILIYVRLCCFPQCKSQAIHFSPSNVKTRSPLWAPRKLKVPTSKYLHPSL